MDFKIKAKGHVNVSSKHKSTFEITKDVDLSPAGDCIIGVAIDKAMSDFSDEFKQKLANENTEIIVKLATENAYDEIHGFGHSNLSLDHPTDLVCRKSNFTCSRTLMINSDKAAKDLNRDLIDDLVNGCDMEVIITLI